MLGLRDKVHVFCVIAATLFVSTCGGKAQFSGGSNQGANTKTEETTEQPTEVAGGFGLTCLPADHTNDSSKTDLSCTFLDANSRKFQERPDLKLDLQIKSDSQDIPFVIQPDNSATNFTFTAIKAEADKVNIGVKFINPQDGNKVVKESATKLLRTIAPEIEIPSKSFNTVFSTKISEGGLHDPNFAGIRYTINGAAPTCATGTAETSQAFDLDIPAATTTLIAITCDSLGVASPAATTVYTYDDLPPSVSITTSVASITNVTPIPVTITFSESMTGFSRSGITVGNGTAESFSGSGTTYTANIKPTADGAVTVDIAANRAQDAATNGNTVATQLSRTYDSTPPTSPSVVINGNASNTSTTAATLTLSAGGASAMYVSNTAGCATGGTWEAYGTSKSWTLGQTNTTATVYAKFRDLAGNETACVSDIIIHDNTVPLAPVIADASKSFNAIFSTSIQQGGPVDPNFKEFRYTTTSTDPTCSTGTASSTLPTSVTIPAGTTTLKAISCDLAGNFSAVATAVYTYDVTPPNAPTVTGATPTSNTTPTWSWTSGGGGGSATYRFRLNNSDMSTGTTTTTSLSYTPGSALSEATHTLYVQERDAAGNWSASGIFPIQVITPPAAPTLSTPSRNVTSLGLSWAGVTGATSYNLYWSTAAGVTTASTKISNVVSVHTHTPLTGGTTYYYKLAAVKSGVEGALSNEVSATPGSSAAPTVASISPDYGSKNGGLAVTITGTGFVSGATVSIGGGIATGVILVSATTLKATTPAGSPGAQNVVVTNPSGVPGTLTSGFTYSTAIACGGDCYLEGSSPNFAQGLMGLQERIGPEGTILTLQSAQVKHFPFKIWKEKVASGPARILNASGRIENGWQKKLNPNGVGFQSDYFTDSSPIIGRVCPINVFISHAQMAATDRCLYRSDTTGGSFKNGEGGIEAQWWLKEWDRVLTGQGVGASYYEGNIQNCSIKNMRLPVIYETNAYTTICPSCDYPSGDSIPPPQGPTTQPPNDKTFLEAKGPDFFKTASANPNNPSEYFSWIGVSGHSPRIGFFNYDEMGWLVICVLPSH